MFEPWSSTIQSTAPVLAEHELPAGLQSVVRTLLYYHIFDYPLTAAEILRFSSHPWNGLADVEGATAILVKRSLIGADRGFFFVGEDSHVDERVADQARARAALPRAEGWSRFISRFPYVRGVAISGTLSKGVMKEGDDLDYLVFTEPGRVWLCRLLLMGFKKLFLFNSHHRFCINYLLAADRLSIPDRDRLHRHRDRLAAPHRQSVDLWTVHRGQLLGRGSPSQLAPRSGDGVNPLTGGFREVGDRGARRSPRRAPSRRSGVIA